MSNRPIGAWAAARGVAALLALLAGGPVLAASEDFGKWMSDFRAEAKAKGISEATLDAALDGVEPKPAAIREDRAQPEFAQSFEEYAKARVSEKRVEKGLEMMRSNAAALRRADRKYGVDKEALAAFWGMETNYGSVMGDLPIPASLATLAYEGRRGAFFRSQLLDALRIIEDGKAKAEDLKGSWAGAMGQMQFMPSTFLAYGVDGDGDGKIDLRGSAADALSSGANYLKSEGWRKGEPIAVEARLPKRFDWSQAREGNRKEIAKWERMGVRPIGGKFPKRGMAELILPEGRLGPAFLAFGNYGVAMRWNKSPSYALSVGILERRLKGGKDLSGKRSSSAERVRSGEIAEAQEALARLGFDPGEADGKMGPAARGALRRYQESRGLPADGYPDSATLQRLRKDRAGAEAKSAEKSGA